MLRSDDNMVKVKGHRRTKVEVSIIGQQPWLAFTGTIRSVTLATNVLSERFTKG